MTKTITINEVEELYMTFRNWESVSKEIKLTPKNLYNLISLKKTIENEHSTVTETVQTIFTNNDLHPDERGRVQIPEDKQEGINDELAKFGESTVDIHFESIAVREEDNLPVILMEKLFDFLRVEE